MITLTISAAILWASNQIKNCSDNSRLEAEVLLAHAMQVTRSHFLAWPDKCLSIKEQENFFSYVMRRQQGEPIAYITGQKEFWSLNLIVTSDTLIPRPETELIVELVLEKVETGSNDNDDKKNIADLGTGCGAIALALAHERPQWRIFATDRMSAALKVAKTNAQNLGLEKINFYEGNWCAALPALEFDCIVSNPPYIAQGDPDLDRQVCLSEPLSALISGMDGLNDIRQIIQEAKNVLKSGGYLILEHGFTQASAVKALMQQAGYVEINNYRDLAGLERITLGRKAK